jgi:hypothetical protein
MTNELKLKLENKINLLQGREHERIKRRYLSKFTQPRNTN